MADQPSHDPPSDPGTADNGEDGAPEWPPVLPVSSHHSLWKEWTIPSGGQGLTVVGYSRAGDKTSFWLPQLKWFLDAGGSPSANYKPSAVFLTHTHSDHAYYMPWLVSSRHATEIFVPEGSEGFVDAYIDASQKMNSCREEGFPYADFNITPVNCGDLVDVGKRHVARVLDCAHPVPCVGYGIEEKRKKLKPEYVGLPGAEIGRLRKSGVEVQDSVTIPLFCFMGDTNASVLDDQESILATYPVVFIECTNLREADLAPDESFARGHIHWESLKPFVVAHPDTMFVLIHFSGGYKDDEIRSFFADQGLANVMPFV